MIRSIKALGVALLAFAAFGAFAAGSAQAAAGEAHITTEQKAVITADGQNDVLQIGSQSITCKTSQVAATVQGSGSQITTNNVEGTARYQGCEYVALKAKAEVKLNGCLFRFRGTAELTAQAQIVECTPFKKIEIVAAGGLCTITIGEQGELKHVTFTNDAESETTKHHLQGHSTISNITYTRDGAFCPQGEASYSGTTTVKAFQDIESKQVEESGHKYTEHVCGGEVGILAT